MARTQEQKAIEEAARRKVKRPLSNRIFALILMTEALLALIAMVITIIMFYRESRYIPKGEAAALSNAAHMSLARYIVAYIILIAAASLLIAFLMRRYITNRIVGPIDEIAAATQDYIIDKSDGTLDETHFFDLHIDTEDELENLALVLRDMERSMHDYVDNLTKVTREKERISIELDLANRIQSNMLPSVFPPYPDRKELDIYASMDPAKEVGGDFYDFFLIDEDHLGLVMADVSGKGIPAALFMMMARIMINSVALSGASPATVLERVNKKICENNETEMFVTVWLGLVTISTGHVVAANAGHEYPMIRKPDGRFELLKDVHGFVVGGMEGARYKEYDFTLEKGGTLFLYTDGLAEANDEQGALFGTDRILDILNKKPDADSKTLLRNMTVGVDRFVGQAPQFDDLTMMAVRLLEVDPEESDFPETH